MKWANVIKLFLVFCKAFSRILLALLLFFAAAALAFDRLVLAKIPRAFPSPTPLADAQVRRGIDETFEFRPCYADVVHEVFEKEHPGLEQLLGRGLSRSLVIWCVSLHESSRLEATVRGAVFFDADAEIVRGLDAASRHWLHHGIESATPDELQALKEQFFSNTHPAWRRYCEKHPAGEGL